MTPKRTSLQRFECIWAYYLFVALHYWLHANTWRKHSHSFIQDSSAILRRLVVLCAKGSFIYYVINIGGRGGSGQAKAFGGLRGRGQKWPFFDYVIFEWAPRKFTHKIRPRNSSLFGSMISTKPSTPLDPFKAPVWQKLCPVSHFRKTSFVFGTSLGPEGATWKIDVSIYVFTCVSRFGKSWQQKKWTQCLKEIFSWNGLCCCIFSCVINNG